MLRFMMLTSRGRYAVMALLELAVLSKCSRPISLFKLSSAQNIPLKYLEQIFCKLKKAGLVKSVKGPGGGYILNNSSDKINIADIFDAVNENIKMTKCSKNKTSCMRNSIKCKTHELWQGLGDQIRNYFSHISVADLVDNQTSKYFQQS